MNITLQILASEKNYEPTKPSEKHRLGDIVNIYQTSQLTEPPSPNSPLVFVHITGVPNTLIEKIKKLKEAKMGEESPTTGIKEFIFRHDWRVDRSMLSASIRQKLLNDRQITVTWEQAKPFIKRKSVAENASSLEQ